MEYDRDTSNSVREKERVLDFNEFHKHLSLEKQQLQGVRCMEYGVPFCQSGMLVGSMTSGCPLHNLIPEWNDLVYTGNWLQAYNRLKKINNFPEFTARVCPELCEAACTCGLNGEAVAIKENEYAIIENVYKNGYADPVPPKVLTGKKVAVIGSGPSGLAAADQLNKRGHSVTVFESSDRIGGLLMYGIPNMKLEKSIVERKVNVMKAERIEFVTGANVGKDKKISQLLKEYDKLILACGASNPRDITVPGRLKMNEIEGSEKVLDADIVLIAAGFLGSEKYVTDTFKAELNERGNVKIAVGMYNTNVKMFLLQGICIEDNL